MNELLANAYFKDFSIPLISVLLTIGVKLVSRKDTFLQATREDFAIGFDLAVTAIILLVLFASRTAVEVKLNTSKNVNLCKEKLELIPWLISSFIFGLWVISTLVRRFGWKQGPNKELHIFWGVIFPDVIGLLALLYIVNYTDL